jgi:tetratricopeptide (TPR) repeat protein
MAPEQFVSTELDAAADQYSFCVTLWEALYGKRPLRSDAARRREAPKRRGVPSWLRRCCDRGLAEEPKQRWPSMTALLDALARGHTRARLRTGLVAVGVLAALGAGVEGLRRLDVARRVAACEASGDEIETAWNDDRRQALQAALTATESSHAALTAEKAMPWLDAQARAWREARVETCLDAEVRGHWDTNMLDRSLWCLDERRSELGSLVDELTQADPREVLPKVVPSVLALRRVAPCRDEALLEAQAAPSAELRDSAREVREKLVRVSTLRYVGQLRKGLALAEEALADAEALEWPPLIATARLHVGLMLDELGSYAEAEAALEEAYFEADQGVAPGVPVHAAAKLVVVVGVRLARPAEGLRWGRHADAALSELGAESSLQRGTLLGNLASVREAEGAYAEARELHEQALAIKQELLGAEHLVIATNLSGLATIHRELGSYDEAGRLQVRLLELLQQALGPEHPSVAATLQNLANVRAVSGDYEEAKALQEQALTLRQKALGPEHPEVGVGLVNLGTIHESLGDYEAAKSLHQRARAILEAALGPDHPHVALSLYGLANAYKLLGDHAQAEALHERALAIREKTLGSDHPAVARSLIALAGLAFLRGRGIDAMPLAQRAVTILEKGAPAEELALAHFLLARALYEAPEGEGGDPSRALELAEHARDALRGVGKGGAEQLAEVEQWLAAHAGE